MPEPDEIIGVKFKFVENNASGIFGYQIWDVSTWQGKCMNYPVEAPHPKSIAETDSFFDYEIVNSDDYQISYRNKDEWMFTVVQDTAYYDSVYRSRPGVGLYSHRGWMLIKNEEAEVDTLWLRAKDYAAKAIISPRNLSGKRRNRMNMRTDAYGNSIWTISVPTDDDGIYIYGSNRGDYMADAWEEDNILPGKSIVYFMPFANWSRIDPYLPTDHPSADQDYILKGRTFGQNQIYGDRLCNFAEYRGFWICGDQNKLYSTGKHRRTDPNLKTVFLHISTLIPDSLHKYFPGHISAIDDSLEVFFTDSVGYYKPDKQEYRTSKKFVTRNTIGAARFYYGYPNLTIFPFAFTAIGYQEFQQAITFWLHDFIQIQIYGNLGNTVGITRGLSWEDATHGNTVLCPELVKQIELNFDLMDTCLTNLLYYIDHPDSLAPHRE